MTIVPPLHGRRRATMPRMRRSITSGSLPAFLPSLPVAALVVAVVVANVWFTAWTVAEMIQFPSAVDWVVLTTAAERIRTGLDPYAFAFGDGSFRWSPVVAWLFTGIGLVGPLAWRLLHFGALLLIPNRQLAVVALLSWPFWFDVATGNIMTFVFVIAVLALRGNRIAAIGTIALTILVPRPLMLPLAAWLLWRTPGLWRWGVALFAAHGAALLVTGWAGEWLFRLLTLAPDQIGISFDVGPARLIGAFWAPIGAVLAISLTLRGRVGWAALAACPYWLPYYLFTPLLELDRRRWKPCPVGAEGP